MSGTGVLPRGLAAELHVRRATDEDRAAMVDLLRTSLGAGVVPRTQAYWRWKHELNPFGASPVLVAEDAGRLVGLRAFMRWDWRCGGTRAAAVRAVDTATHPDYQGRGIFKRLTLQLRDEVEADGAALVFNTPNSQSRPGYLKMGWSVVGRPTLWVRAVHPIRLMRALRGEGLGGEEVAPPAVDAPTAGDFLTKEDAADLEDFVAAAAAGLVGGYHTPLTAGYLRWRYAEIPGFTYHGLRMGAGEDGALVLFRARRRGQVRELRIGELLVGPTRAARRHAVRLLRQLRRSADVDVILAMPAGRGRARRALLQAGYIPAPRTGPILTVYPFPAASGLPDPRQMKNWCPSIGDLELF